VSDAQEGSYTSKYDKKA